MAEKTEPTVVSFDDESLVLVDDADRVIGYASKKACHEGKGILHRAFSLFVLDDRARVLLQQRAKAKLLWPGYWSNSCCSHPRRGESMAEATQRRLEEELGLRCPMRYLYKFQYRATFESAGTEHELCWVYAGTSDAAVLPNENEIASWRWIEPEALDRELTEAPERFTPWLKMEWRRLRADYPALFAGTRDGRPPASATPPELLEG